MIQYPSTAASTQQIQVPAYQVPQMPEFNAIKININGAQVGTPTPVVYPAPPVSTETTLPAPANAGENIDVNA